jgi:photosystem II stability/assembly factor-like uncharacterized protein
MVDAFLGTASGVLRLRDRALESLGLDGHSVTALHASDDALLAGTYGDGLFRSADGGRSWERIEAGLTASTFRFLTAELAGTEPARVYRSPDGGRTWEELDGITKIPGHEQWFLPYSPRVGREGRIVSSSDGGDTWEGAGHGIDVPMPDMVEVFVPAPDGTMWAICSGGRLLWAAPDDWSWSSAVPRDGVTVKSVAFPDGSAG